MIAEEIDATLGRIRLALVHRNRDRAYRIIDDLFSRAGDPRELPYSQRIKQRLEVMFEDDTLIVSHLAEIGATTVGDLCGLTLRELRAVPNFGPARVTLIQRRLRSWGLSLRHRGRLLSH